MKQNRFVIYVGKDMLDDAFRDLVDSAPAGCLSEYIKHRVVLAELMTKGIPLSNPLDPEEVGRVGFFASRGPSVGAPTSGTNLCTHFVTPTSAPTLTEENGDIVSAHSLVQETSAPIENHGQGPVSEEAGASPVAAKDLPPRPVRDLPLLPPEEITAEDIQQANDAWKKFIETGELPPKDNPAETE